jgi:hypothetical protein
VPGSQEATAAPCDTFMFMSELVREEECDRKAAEWRIAAKVAAEDPFRGVYLDLAANWRKKGEAISAAKQRPNPRSAGV